MFWGLAVVERTGLAVAYVLCHTCHRQDPTNQRVEALLERRYGGGGGPRQRRRGAATRRRAPMAAPRGAQRPPQRATAPPPPPAARPEEGPLVDGLPLLPPAAPLLGH